MRVKLIAVSAVVAGALVMGIQPALAQPVAAGHKNVCAGGGPAGVARCHADVVVDGSGKALATVGYTYGYSPADLASAYKFNRASGTWAWNGETIAIVDAYDDPNVATDLAAYRSQFGLPACTVANGCFTKIDEWGGTNYPAANVGWGQEISLDVDMASATCGNCKIMLVEAASSSFSDLAAAVDRAAARGANAISNSYGGKEFAGETSWDSHYNHPGIAITVSSGDSGYGTEYPAASRYVTAVGGTSLVRATNARGWSETAWTGAGSGCSVYESKPTWQVDSGCATRTVADVAAVADPSTGVAVYDSYGANGGANWYVFGGTSVASPIVAGMYALAANPSSVSASYPYSHTASLFDVTSGRNGQCRRSLYLCTAGPGYDGPTGLGTPNGTGAF